MSSKLPFISSDIPRDLRSFLDRVRELLSGTGPERVVRAKDLISAGIATSGPAGTLIPGPPKVGPPSIPLNVSASGAIATIIITWDPPTYSGHAYAEIWTAPTNDINTAVLLAQSNSDIFSDAVGASVSRYYWVRFVSVGGLIGKFNSTAGTLGQTGDDPDYLMEVLSDAYGTTSLAPFFQIDSPTVINGVTIPAGTYIKQAIIADATISRAKIQDLAVDNAKIDNLNATKINAGFLSADRIQAGSIDASKISFTVVSTSNVVGAINASSEGIRISGARIQIDGNVTFSAGYDPTTKIVSGGAATDVNNNATTISGGKITTNTLSADRIESNTTKTVNNTVFGLGTSTTVGGIQTGGQFLSSSISFFGCVAGNTNAGSAFGAGTTDSTGVSGAIFAIGNANSAFNTWTVSCALSSGFWSLNAINRGGTGSNIAGIYLGYAQPTWTTGYAYYITAGVGGPFTAAHDGLQKLTNTLPELGDILVDVVLIAAPSVNDSITEVAVSSTASQKGVIGVYAGLLGTGFVPASLGEDVNVGPEDQTAFVLRPEFENIFDTYRPLVVNAIGEGKVNICGEGGDIEIGDLIVTSSIAGKGMKQSDDLVRSITVAKARENVTFSSPTEVKQIACIYLCG
jgi:hypothetical protein